jgi:hypothetical protein
MLGSKILELFTPWLEARELACGCLKLFLANFGGGPPVFLLILLVAPSS